MHHWPRSPKHFKGRTMKGNNPRSSRKPLGGLKYPSSSVSNFSNRVRSSIASPAKKHKRNWYNHSWKCRRSSEDGGLRWTARGSQSTTPRRSWYHSTPSPQPQRPKVQDQNTPLQSICKQDISKCQKLNYGAYIGNETRHLEFKKGGGCYQNMNFSQDAYKYGCAFLNSGGGSLLVGVCDNGVVCGVSYNHKEEDRTRLQVDLIVKLFKPPLFPHNYNLRFLPVIKPGKHHLKVLCLTFKAPPAYTEPTIYQVNKGHVYIRQDGGVQGPLSVSDVIEYMRQKWARKVQQPEHWFVVGQVQGIRKALDPLEKIIASLQQQITSAQSSSWQRRKVGKNMKSSSSQCFPASCGNSDAGSAHDTEDPDLALQSPPPPEHN